MDVRARLIPTHVPTKATAAVLVLHGGAGRRGAMRVSPTQLSVLRMIPIARRIARAGGDDIAVFRLLNSVRGWDASHTPVDDVRWALAQVRSEYGLDVPICLVGHSLGARAAVLAAGERAVHSVVALAAFVYPEDGDVDAHGISVVFVHGTRDRIARIARAEDAARRLERTARVGFLRVVGGKHAMLRHFGTFDGLAAAAAVATLTGDFGGRARSIATALQGRTSIDV